MQKLGEALVMGDDHTVRVCSGRALRASVHDGDTQLWHRPLVCPSAPSLGFSKIGYCPGQAPLNIRKANSPFKQA